MNAIVKYVVGHTYKPWLEKYLSKKRIYRHNGFTLEIPPEVFHPGFFHSTQLLMKQLDQFSLPGKSLLELGAGSGLISFHAAKQGAMVTATDLNQTAVEFLNINSKLNGIELMIIHADLFSGIPLQQFDFIVINPPYYKGEALTEKDLAWYCGSQGEYFERLFQDIGNYLHNDSDVLMVLCDGCDLEMIEGMASKHGFVLVPVCTKRTIIETNYIFRIRKLKDRKSFREKDQADQNQFARLYCALRRKEDRIYTDQQLIQLPSIEPSHVHAREWAVRRESAEKLIQYLRSESKNLRILEIGCGNGWLAKWLSEIPGSNVTGIDVNQEELAQARRVFGNIENLQFLEGDINMELLANNSFDVIVFAASIQYFENLRQVLQSAINLLKKEGSIHIIDTFFYEKNEVGPAIQRTREYFSKMGYPSMSDYYFHHSFDSIKIFNYNMLHDPKKLTNRLLQKDRVFPWIMVQPNH